MSTENFYYHRDLALIHHLGFDFHANACAPGILRLLQSVRSHDGLVLELGCGSGALTRHLLDGRHRVIATDASPAMVELARENAPEAEEVFRLTLPDDPLPEADAIVAVGHVLNYLPDEAAVDRALIAIANALRPGGMIALDLCDLSWGDTRADDQPHARVTDDWVVVTRYSLPAPDHYVREITALVRDTDGSWRRDDERHDNVLIDTSRIPALLADYGVVAQTVPAFGDEELPQGMVALIGQRQ